MFFLGPKELITSDSHKALIDNALDNKKARNPQIKSRTLLIPLKLDALVLEYAKATEVPYTSAALDLIQRGLKARFPGHSSQLSPLMITKFIGSMPKQELSMPSNAELDLRKGRKNINILKIFRLARPVLQKEALQDSSIPKEVKGFDQSQVEEALGMNRAAANHLLKAMVQMGGIDKVGVGAAAKYFLKKGLSTEEIKTVRVALEKTLPRSTRKRRPVFDLPPPITPAITSAPHRPLEGR
jgi:hypothetical protein